MSAFVISLQALGFGAVVPGPLSLAKLGMQPLRLQWERWIVFGTGDQQQRGLRMTSGHLVRAADEVEPTGEFARGVAPRVADVESAFVGRNYFGELAGLNRSSNRTSSTTSASRTRAVAAHLSRPSAREG